MGWAGVAKEAARGLTAVRGRSALALVGIVVGIGSVIAMVSTGEIVREQAMKQFEALGTDIVTARTYYVPRLRRVVTFPLDAIMAIDAEVAEIETAAGWNETNARLSHRGRDIEGAGMLGVTGSFADVANLEVAEGRFVSDLDARQRYCVVGAGIARAMRAAGAERVLGQRVKLAGQLWNVIGVLAPSAVSRFNYAPDKSVYIPVRAAVLFTDQDAVGDVIARVRPGVETEAGAQAMLAYLRASADGIEVKAKTAEQLIAGMRRQGRLFTVLLAAVGGIALVVGGGGHHERDADLGERAARRDRAAPGGGRAPARHPAPVRAGGGAAVHDGGVARDRGRRHRGVGDLPLHRLAVLGLGGGDGGGGRGLDRGGAAVRGVPGAPGGATGPDRGAQNMSGDRPGSGNVSLHSQWALA